MRSGEPLVGGDWAAVTEECQKLRVLCSELRKEKDSLKESLSREQAVNAELIRRFELEAHTTLDVCSKESKHIEDLKREVNNCSQEIAFLQDQLCRRNSENQFVDEHAETAEHNHEIKMLHKKLKLLEKELVHSESMRIYFINKAGENDAKLQNLSAQVKKLESAVSSIQLESQCEIESMKLDMMALEQRCFETERSFEQVAKEKAQIEDLFNECSLQLKECECRISYLEKNNKELYENIETSERCMKTLFSELDGHINIWLKRNPTFLCQPEQSCILSTNLEKDLSLLIDKDFEDILRSFLKNFFLLSYNECSKYDVQKIPNQIRESERLILQLKEELRNEKLRSKEEAEDLIQAMAELRYQSMGMLEEETKRRVIVEQASLKRIQELEAEVQREKHKSLKTIWS